MFRNTGANAFAKNQMRLAYEDKRDLYCRQEGYFPTRIALPFFRYCLTTTETVQETDMLESFLNYIPHLDKICIQTAVNKFDDVDQDELLDILSGHDVRTLPTETNILPTILEIAHRELIQSAAYVADCWRPSFLLELSPILKGDIKDICAALEPTTRKVLAILKFPDDMARSQVDTMNFMKRFVKSMNPDMLKLFLRFCTGKIAIWIYFHIYMECVLNYYCKYMPKKLNKRKLDGCVLLTTKKPYHPSFDIGNNLCFH